MMMSKSKADLSDNEDDVAWALELEEAIGCAADNSSSDTTSDKPDNGAYSDPRAANEESSAIVQQHEDTSIDIKPRSIASELPLDVLINIMSYGQVGRVCTSWSLATSTLARRKFSDRLTEILLPWTPNALVVAQEVEANLFLLHGQSYSLPKKYGQKARQLLFNLKDSRNSQLRDRLLSGDLSAHTLVRMSSTDMANPQLVRQRKEWIRKRTHEVMRDREMEGFLETDMFECRSCGGTRTRYRQMRRKAIVDRTRIVILCLLCAYNWEL